MSKKRQLYCEKCSFRLVRNKDTVHSGHHVCMKHSLPLYIKCRFCQELVKERHESTQHRHYIEFHKSTKHIYVCEQDQDEQVSSFEYQQLLSKSKSLLGVDSPDIMIDVR